MTKTDATLPTIGYAIGTDHDTGGDQMSGLILQQQIILEFCQASHWPCEMGTDPGYGTRGREGPLRRVLGVINHRQLRRLVVTSEERLRCSGAGLLIDLCDRQGVEVIDISQSA